MSDCIHHFICLGCQGHYEDVIKDDKPAKKKFIPSPCPGIMCEIGTCKGNCRPTKVCKTIQRKIAKEEAQPEPDEDKIARWSCLYCGNKSKGCMGCITLPFVKAIEGKS